MATIGLNNVVYAPITFDSNGEEQYGTVKKLATAISVGLTINKASATLYGDDALDEKVDLFTSGTLSFNATDIPNEELAAITGAKVDANGVLVSGDADVAPYVAIGFSALRSNGKYSYYWLYKVQFTAPNNKFNTKGDSITFNTPTVEGTIFRRAKKDFAGNNPYKAEVTDGVAGVTAQTIQNWFDSVYEPVEVASA